jgi:hypothetical protein
MTHENVFEVVLLKQCVVNVKHSPARIAEDELNVLLLQASHDDFRARNLAYFLLVAIVHNVLVFANNRGTLNSNCLQPFGQGWRLRILCLLVPNKP